MWEFLVFWGGGDPDMKRKRHSEEKIVSILNEHETGAFRDLFQPQRIGALSACLANHVPAGMTAGLLFAK